MQKSYNTKSKDLIMKFVEKHSDKAFTAADIIRFLDEQNFSVNTTTVYRNIEKLTKTGTLIKRKSTGNESCEYQLATVDACQEHIHMQCTSCSKIFHLECDFMKDIAHHLYNHHNFSLDCIDSMLKGLCKKCSIKNKKTTHCK